MTLRYPALLVLLALAVTAHAQRIEFKGVAPGLLEQRLRLATPKTAERFARLRSLFEETGCTTLTEQKVKGSKEPNLICSEGGDAPDTRKILITGPEPFCCPVSPSS